jgi:transcriptional regulator with XRE-family HTH domain
MYRNAHGWSARDLAERCTAAGVPLDETVISDVENDRRADVSVQELLTLAFVLSVPPVLLFVPVGEDYHVEVTPGVLVAPDAAVRWVSGEAMMSGDPSPAIWQRFSRPLHLYRQLDDAHAHRWNAESELRRTNRDGSPAEQAAARARYSLALANISMVLTAIVEDGMTVPPVKDYTARDMAKLGLAVPPGVPTVATDEQALV